MTFFSWSKESPWDAEASNRLLWDVSRTVYITLIYLLLLILIQRINFKSMVILVMVFDSLDILRLVNNTYLACVKNTLLFPPSFSSSTNHFTQFGSHLNERVLVT